MFSDEVIMNAIFVCSFCKKLTLVMRDLWTSDSSSSPDPSTAPRRRQQNQLVGSSTYVVHHDLKSWRFRTSYHQMLEDFRRRQCSDFPLCSNCISLLCPRWRYETQYLTEQTAYLTRLSPADALARYQELERANTRLKNDVSAFQEVSRQYSSEIEKISHPSSISSRSSEESLAPLARGAPAPAPPPYARPPHTFPGLAFASAYRITTHHHYGCINDNRLGMNAPDPVPPDEVDRALFFVAHMVQALGRLAGVGTEALAIGAAVVLKTEKEGAVALTTTDLKSSKGQRLFRAATAALVEILYGILESPLFVESDFSPPHRIDLARQEIAGDKFLYEKGKPEVFTAAMKHLLFSLKYTQKWALHAAVRGAADE